MFQISSLFVESYFLEKTAPKVSLFGKSFILQKTAQKVRGYRKTI